MFLRYKPLFGNKTKFIISKTKHFLADFFLIFLFVDLVSISGRNFSPFEEKKISFKKCFWNVKIEGEKIVESGRSRGLDRCIRTSRVRIWTLFYDPTRTCRDITIFLKRHFDHKNTIISRTKPATGKLIANMDSPWLNTPF